MGRYRLEREIADFDGQMLCEHGCTDAGSRPDTRQTALARRDPEPALGHDQGRAADLDGVDPVAAGVTPGCRK
jgi:hypothetical protein